VALGNEEDLTTLNLQIWPLDFTRVADLAADGGAKAKHHEI
jgi:hypothetical protein